MQMRGTETKEVSYMRCWLVKMCVSCVLALSLMSTPVYAADSVNYQEKSFTETVIAPAGRTPGSGTLYRVIKHTQLRKKANSSSSVVMELRIGSTVTVMSSSGTWKKAQLNGKTGYVQESCITRFGP